MRVGRSSRLQVPAQRFSPLGGTIPNRDPARAGQGEFDGNGASRSTRAQHEYVLSGGINSRLLAHAAQKTFAIRIFADEFVTRAPHGVDRADQGRIG